MTVIRKLIGRVAQSRLSVPLKGVTRYMREQYYNAVVLSRLDNKIRPLDVTTDASLPRRINLIVPEISFASFYGGYIAKVNLARRLTDRGYKVRIVIIDQCDVDPDKLNACVAQYEGVETLFDDVEVAYHFDRTKALACHPEDGVIATTWWSAFVANELQKHLVGDRFLYLIQEYEPFTFAMGSYFAMAHNSYSLSHYALFSSELLREYFRQHQIGVYSSPDDGTDKTAVTDGGNIGEWGDSRSRSFENAIVAYSQDERQQAGRDASQRPRRLLFYARPEAHATRNMFEIGFTGLQAAIDKGVFAKGAWEFYGIGTSHSDIALGDNHTLKMLGKFGLEQYRQALLRYDIGLSLMYTPHPSLLPLEMAAAGMLVVTNTCLNKTAAKMSAISSNLLAAHPDTNGVVDMLAVAVKRLDESDAARLSPVHWSSDWQQTFGDALLGDVEHWLGLRENVN